MSLNKEEIKKVLGLCSSEDDTCSGCPVDKQLQDDCTCGSYVMGEALRYIKELERKNKALEAENERLVEEFSEIFDYAIDKIREARHKATLQVVDLFVKVMSSKKEGQNNV